MKINFQEVHNYYLNICFEIAANEYLQQFSYMQLIIDKKYIYIHELIDNIDFKYDFLSLYLIAKLVSYCFSYLKNNKNASTKEAINFVLKTWLAQEMGLRKFYDENKL